MKKSTCREFKIADVQAALRKEKRLQGLYQAAELIRRDAFNSARQFNPESFESVNCRLAELARQNERLAEILGKVIQEGGLL